MAAAVQLVHTDADDRGRGEVSGYTPTQVTLDQGQPLSLTPLSDRREDLVTQQGVHPNSGYTSTVGTPQQWVHPNAGHTRSGSAAVSHTTL